MASVEICWRKRNLKSSCDDIIGTVEDARAIIIMKICGMYDIFGRRILLQETSMYMPHIYQNRSRARRHEGTNILVYILHDFTPLSASI